MTINVTCCCERDVSKILTNNILSFIFIPNCLYALQMKEITVSSSYSSKPFLFGGDGKILNFTGGKSVGMLDRFEEEKRKAKEKFER